MNEYQDKLDYRKKLDAQWKKLLVIYEKNKDKYTLSCLVSLMTEYNETDKWLIENDRNRR